MKLPVVHHPGYTIALPEAHPFPMAKFRVLREHLDTSPMHASAQWLRPEPVSLAAVRRVHTAEYLDALLDGSLDRAAQRRSGFKWSEDLVLRVRLETGGTLMTVEAALDAGLACNTAGGTHHAHAGAASGYCLINDIAVATAHARAEGWAQRVLVVDLDVHQGDGTAGLFDREPDVFTFSMHAASNFPAHKGRSDLDIALRKGVSDEEYLQALASTLPGLLQTFRPDLVIYDAGVDVHRHDRLGHLALTDEGISRRDRYVFGCCREAGIPVAAVIGGGYDRDLDALASRHARLHQAAVEYC
ncbi:histone deacetylase [Aquisalimonas sp.]|uniref:histone deacetylase family protein n=1 Tax=Aquisalimonas sp. TaxID=1872621 RepID=UPI0025C08400|nr:histone deacetylase [Aquisalimonas sp.]